MTRKIQHVISDIPEFIRTEQYYLLKKKKTKQNRLIEPEYKPHTDDAEFK